MGLKSSPIKYIVEKRAVGSTNIVELDFSPVYNERFYNKQYNNVGLGHQ